MSINVDVLVAKRYRFFGWYLDNPAIDAHTASIDRALANSELFFHDRDTRRDRCCRERGDRRRYYGVANLGFVNYRGKIAIKHMLNCADMIRRGIHRENGSTLLDARAQVT